MNLDLGLSELSTREHAEVNNAMEPIAIQYSAQDFANSSLNQSSTIAPAEYGSHHKSANTFFPRGSTNQHLSAEPSLELFGRNPDPLDNPNHSIFILAQDPDHSKPIRDHTPDKLSTVQTTIGGAVSDVLFSQQKQHINGENPFDSLTAGIIAQDNFAMPIQYFPPLPYLQQPEVPCYSQLHEGQLQRVLGSYCRASTPNRRYRRKLAPIRVPGVNEYGRFPCTHPSCKSTLKTSRGYKDHMRIIHKAGQSLVVVLKLRQKSNKFCPASKALLPPQKRITWNKRTPAEEAKQSFNNPLNLAPEFR